MAVTAEKMGNRIHLWTPKVPWGDDDAFERLKTACKRVNGAYWSDSKKRWTYPLDYGTCLELRRVWGDQLQIGKELWAWAKAERVRRADLFALGQRDRYDLTYVETFAPILAAAMANRKYQQVGAAWAAKAGFGLLGDDPGTGKTLQAMGAVIETGIEDVNLVVAPATAVRLTWLPEIRQWLPGDEVYTCHGTRAQRMRAIELALAGQGRRWLVVNPEMFEVPHDIVKKGVVVGHRDVFYHDLIQRWGSVIVDESHDCLITTTGKKEKQPYFRQGLGQLTVVDGGIRLAMSGTPFRGKLTNLWGTLNWLNPKRYTSYWRWIEAWFVWYEDPIHGHRVVEGLRPELAERFYEELDSVMLRRTKPEVAPELPAKFYAGRPLKNQTNGAQGVWLPMSAPQKKAYAEMRKDASARLEGGVLLADGTLAEMTRLRQFAVSAGRMDEKGLFHPALPSNKFDWVLNWLDQRDMRNPGDTKVIIASQFSEVLEMFDVELRKQGIETLMITGKVTGRRREEAKENFQSAGGPRVMLLTITAGGVSLTLDAHCDDLIFLDETWIPDQQTQVEDRIHRVSRIHQVTIWYVRSLGSIEHHIAISNLSLDDIQRYAMDGRRGINILRQFISDIPEEKIDG